MMAIVGTLALNLNVTLPLFVTRSIRGTETDFTLLYSVLSVGSVGGALWAARRTAIEVSHVIAGTVAFGTAMLLLSAMPNLWAAFPAGFLLGVAGTTFVTTSSTLVQVRADPVMRGRVVALQSMVFMGSSAIGGPIVGGVSEAFGGRAGLILGGSACLGAALLGVIVARPRSGPEAPQAIQLSAR